MKHERHIAGDDGYSKWVQPVEVGYRMSCCDCGLVHKMDFRVSEDGRAQFRSARHSRATAAKRAWKKRQKPVTE